MTEMMSAILREDAWIPAIVSTTPDTVLPPSEATEAVLTRQLAEREPLSAAEAALAWPVDTRAAVDWAQLPPAWR